MQKLPEIRRAPLSPEQRAHLEEVGRIRTEGRAARQAQALERETAAADALQRARDTDAFVAGLERRQAAPMARTMARAAAPSEKAMTLSSGIKLGA
jgi:hypothetical protein